MASQLGGVLGKLQNRLTGMLSVFQSWIDSIVPPERRARIIEKVYQFATDRPFLASFIASWLTFSGLPLGLYIAFCVTVALFALVVGLVVALLATLLFILTMAGFGLMVLFPVLFFTTFAAVVVFGWGTGLYYLIKWTKKDQILADVNQQVRGLLGKDAGEVNTKMHGDDVQGKAYVEDGPEEKDSTPGGSGGKASGNDIGKGSERSDEKPAKRHPGHKTRPGERLGVESTTQPVSNASSGLTAGLAG